MKNIIVALALAGLFLSHPTIAETDEEIRQRLKEEAERIIREKREREAAIPVEEDMGENWIVDNATFNYRLTCDEDQTQFIALVIHGINNKQKLTLNESGELIEPYSVSIGFDRIADFCGAIFIPKSGLSATLNEAGEVEERYRTWWMTDGTPDDNGLPVRAITDEVDAAIDIINFSNNIAPTYLVIGNDYGTMTMEVASKLGEIQGIRNIAGLLHIDRITGEFIRYTIYGNKWSSVYRYHGLKIFTSLRLRFQDFQRMMGFKAFHSAQATIAGIETAHMIRKGQLSSRVFMSGRRANQGIADYNQSR
jgi:hypothetical protein